MIWADTKKRQISLRDLCTTLLKMTKFVNSGITSSKKLKKMLWIVKYANSESLENAMEMGIFAC